MRNFTEIEHIFKTLGRDYGSSSALPNWQPTRFWDSTKWDREDWSCNECNELENECNELEKHHDSYSENNKIRVNTYKQTTKDILNAQCPEEIMTDDQLIEHCNHNVTMNVFGVICKTCNLLLERV